MKTLVICHLFRLPASPDQCPLPELLPLMAPSAPILLKNFKTKTRHLQHALIRSKNQPSYFTVPSLVVADLTHLERRWSSSMTRYSTPLKPIPLSETIWARK